MRIFTKIFSSCIIYLKGKANSSQPLKMVAFPSPRYYEDKYSNGQLMYHFVEKNGNVDGLHESWYENGQPKFRINYKNGELDGLHEEWYPNGRLRFRKNYKNGYWDGLYEEWDFLGNLVECCPDKIRVNF